MTIYRNESPRIFKNPILEALSKTNTWFPAVFWGSIIIASFLIGLLHYELSFLMAGMFFLGGFIFWNFFEYAMHRWVFHFTSKYRLLNKIPYYLHTIHHEYPDDCYRLLAPPLMTVPVVGILFAFFYLCFFCSPNVFPAFSGFMLGYLSYEYTHFYIHFGSARSGYAKNLRKNHLRHHYAWPNALFGVTSPFWDYLFRTYISEDEHRAKSKKDYHEKLH